MRCINAYARNSLLPIITIIIIGMECVAFIEIAGESLS